MGSLLNERERAAENLFAREEELRFFARCRGLDAVASWAATEMGLDEEDAAAYAQRIINRFLGGVGERDLIMTVQNDLERAGKPAVSTTTEIVFAQAVSAATTALKAHYAPPASSGRDPVEIFNEHRQKPNPFWGW